MTTIGTTTATAIFPPCDSPVELAVFSTSLVTKGGAPEDTADRMKEEDKVNWVDGSELGCAVDVMTTIEGSPVPPVEAGLSVMTDVIRTTELAVGGNTVGWGTKALDTTTTAEEEGGGNGEAEVGIKEELS